MHIVRTDAIRQRTGISLRIDRQRDARDGWGRARADGRHIAKHSANRSIRAHTRASNIHRHLALVDMQGRGLCAGIVGLIAGRNRDRVVPRIGRRGCCCRIDRAIRAGVSHRVVAEAGWRCRHHHRVRCGVVSGVSIADAEAHRRCRHGDHACAGDYCRIVAVATCASMGIIDLCRDIEAAGLREDHTAVEREIEASRCVQIRRCGAVGRIQLQIGHTTAIGTTQILIVQRVLILLIGQRCTAAPGQQTQQHRSRERAAVVAHMHALRDRAADNTTGAAGDVDAQARHGRVQRCRAGIHIAATVAHDFDDRAVQARRVEAHIKRQLLGEWRTAHGRWNRHTICRNLRIDHLHVLAAAVVAARGDVIEQDIAELAYGIGCRATIARAHIDIARLDRDRTTRAVRIIEALHTQAKIYRLGGIALAIIAQRAGEVVDTHTRTAVIETRGRRKTDAQARGIHHREYRSRLREIVSGVDNCQDVVITHTGRRICRWAIGRVADAGISDHQMR